MTIVATVTDFVAMMGGTGATAVWAGTTDGAVSNWVARGCLPGGYHTRALYEIKSRGMRPGAELFDLTEEQARVVFGCSPERRVLKPRGNGSAQVAA